MSNSRTVDRPIPHSEAYPLSQRRADTIKHIDRMCESLHLIRPSQVANTYRGMTACEVEAEMVRHMPQGDAK